MLKSILHGARHPADAFDAEGQRDTHAHTHKHTRTNAFVSFSPLQVDVSIGLTG